MLRDMEKQASDTKTKQTHTDALLYTADCDCCWKVRAAQQRQKLRTHLLSKKSGSRGRVQIRGGCNVSQKTGNHASHRSIVQQQGALASPEQGLD